MPLQWEHWLVLVPVVLELYFFVAIADAGLGEIALNVHEFELVGLPLVTNLGHEHELLGDPAFLLAHSYELEIPPILGRDGLSFRIDAEHHLLLLLLELLLWLLLVEYLLPLPTYFLTLPPPVLDEDLFHSSLKRVNVPEI